MSQPSIVCVGSCNIDLITYTKKMPVIGETIKGVSFSQGFGGKGANQAVMAAKLGSDVAMISMLGDDVYGKSTLDNFASLKLDASRVGITKECSSGIATILVDESAHNCIVIVPGANDLITPEIVEKHADVIQGAKVLLTQLEVPLEATMKAMEIGSKSDSTTVIFNPAPADANLPDAIYPLCDVVIPNETEAALLSGVEVTDAKTAEKAARVLMKKGAKAVIVTLGEQGCVYVTDSSATVIPGNPVKAVDSTGAGDSFVGSLAHCLATGDDMTKAIARANVAAAQSVLQPGTQKSYPTAEQMKTIEGW